MARIWARQMLDTLVELGRSYFERPEDERALDRVCALARQLLAGQGEASGTALASEVVTALDALAPQGRIAFLERLYSEFGPDRAAVADAARRAADDPSDQALLDLSSAIEAPRLQLLRRINMAPGGTHAIVRLRAELLEAGRDRPDLAVVDADLKRLLTSWFNRGFLQFEQVGWRTPAVILEKLLAYEAVHEIKGWPDLRRRLADDRRCFAFFHPALPDEPLIFVEVALVKGITARIAPLIDIDAPVVSLRDTDTAIFYSISNCQAGLAGISFGNLLIKQVVDAISAELPNIRTFATLSPVPGFRAWLDRQFQGVDEPGRLLSAEQRAILDREDWIGDDAARAALELDLSALCARYLVRETKRGTALDPVARFHLWNGASVERINWLADRSAKCVRESATLMVNYRYDGDEIVANHEAYASKGKVAMSSDVRRLLARLT